MLRCNLPYCIAVHTLITHVFFEHFVVCKCLRSMFELGCEICFKRLSCQNPVMGLYQTECSIFTLVDLFSDQVSCNKQSWGAVYNLQSTHTHPSTKTLKHIYINNYYNCDFDLRTPRVFGCRITSAQSWTFLKQNITFLFASHGLIQIISYNDLQHIRYPWSVFANHREMFPWHWCPTYGRDVVN